LLQFLERHVRHATLVEVPTSEGVIDALVADPTLQVAAGVRQQLEADARRVPSLRLLPGAFMVEQRRSGFVHDALQRHVPLAARDEQAGDFALQWRRARGPRTTLDLLRIGPTDRNESNIRCGKGQVPARAPRGSDR
jgi:hypothetical protein